MQLAFALKLRKKVMIAEVSVRETHIFRQCSSKSCFLNFSSLNEGSVYPKIFVNSKLDQTCYFVRDRILTALLLKE